MYPPIGRAAVDTPCRGVRFSQKSHKAESYWGLHCFHRFRSLMDGTEAAVACGTEGRWSSPRVVQSSPEARRCGRNSQFAPVTSRMNLAPRENKALKNWRQCLEIIGAAHGNSNPERFPPRDCRRVGGKRHRMV